MAVPAPGGKDQGSALGEMALAEAKVKAVGLCTAPPTTGQKVTLPIMKASGTPSMALLGGMPRTSLEKRQPQQPQRREPRGQELKALVLAPASSPKRKLGPDTRQAVQTMPTGPGLTGVSLGSREELPCLRPSSPKLVKSGPTRKRRPMIEPSRQSSELQPKHRWQRFGQAALEAEP
jgi:hypothetical protein